MMPDPAPLLWTAAAVQLAIAAANLLLPRRLRYRESLASVPPIIRQIFIVHSVYIVLVVLLFAALSLFFASDLVGGSRIGNFVCWALAGFWGLRLPIQVFYYDRRLREAHPGWHLAFSIAIAFLALVYTAAAFHGRS